MVEEVVEVVVFIFQVTIYHILKLFQSPPGTTPAAVSGDLKKPLVSEFYEELIFQDPSAMMRQLLTNTRQLTLGEYKHDTDCEHHYWCLSESVFASGYIFSCISVCLFLHPKYLNILLFMDPSNLTLTVSLSLYLYQFLFTYLH